jgi:arylformamidase
MKIHDITLTIQPGMPVWPGDPPVERSLIYVMGRDGPANVSRLNMTVHAGTHIDAPIHFISGGAGVEEWSLDVLVGPCRVCYVQPAGPHIDATDLEAVHLPPGTTRLLIKTANSQIWERNEQVFRRDFIALSLAAARWLVEKGIRLVAVDYLSVEPFASPEPLVHRTLLSHGIIPVEGVNLTGIAAGEYTLVCLPLKVAGSDGSPARVILIEP